MPNVDGEIWYWYHNRSEPYYHIQLTIKYRKSLFGSKIEKVMLETVKAFKERYAIEVSHVGFDRNHVHFLCKFLPKYSGGQVIRLIKSITVREIFKQIPGVKKELWGGEFWSDGYYLATVSTKGDWSVVERYVRNQGKKPEDVQLRMF